MGQVRKDILNGWKEIGAYVCRDIRTVERWEKQRGLPVRRVPGAGRATVYALIPELDEWLANSKPTENEAASPDSLPESIALPMIAASSDPIPAEPAILVEIPRTPPASGFIAAPAHRAWRFAAIAFAAVVLIAGAWRLLPREQIASAAGPARYTFEPSRSSPSAPYRSTVAGVDGLYLRGMYSYEQRTPDSLQRSERDFSEAISKDPGYAPAYAGLANTYNLMRQYSAMPDAEAYPKAKIAAERAVALDPNLPQAHASLGYIDFFWSRNAPVAEEEFRNAIALDPSSVVAHHWYGSMLIHEGRYPEALEQLDLAQRLEPTSAAIFSTRALALGLNGHRDEAADMLVDLINEVPNAPSPHASLAILSLISPRNPTRYLEQSRRAAELRNDDDTLQVTAAGAPALRAGGEQAMWLAMLKQEQKLHPRPDDRTYVMVDSEAALGQADAAFADLAQLKQKNDTKVIGVVIDPVFLPYHKDPRYIQALQAIGLPLARP